MKTRHGFTLPELMVVLAIASILVTVAIPTYAAYVLKSRRMEGRTALILAMQEQERFYSQNGTYAAFAAAAGDGAGFRWWSGATASSSAYELRAGPCTDADLRSCVMLRALPGTARVDGAFRDPECGVLTLRSDGERGAEGDAGRCWR